MSTASVLKQSIAVCKQADRIKSLLAYYPSLEAILERIAALIKDKTVIVNALMLGLDRIKTYKKGLPVHLDIVRSHDFLESFLMGLPSLQREMVDRDFGLSQEPSLDAFKYFDFVCLSPLDLGEGDKDEIK